MFHSDGLDLPLPSELYRVGHASVLASAEECDPPLNEAIADKSAHHSKEALHLEISDLAAAASTKSQLRNIAAAVKDSKIEAKARDCPKQGCGVQVLATMERDQEWKSCVNGLSQPTYSFIVNSMCDSLPTRNNLLLWNKILSSQCYRCNVNKETLLHVLNACPKLLDHYKWRHDNILHELYSFVRDNVKNQPDIEILCDIVVSSDTIICDKFKKTIPDDVYLTNSRPDLVIVNRKKHVISIVELTVPFETNFRQAYMRKAEKYKELIAGIEQNGFSCNYFSVEVGSRGIVSQGTSGVVQRISGARKKDVKAVIYRLSTICMKCSYVIFRDRCNTDNPPSFVMH